MSRDKTWRKAVHTLHTSGSKTRHRSGRSRGPRGGRMEFAAHPAHLSSLWGGREISKSCSSTLFKRRGGEGRGERYGLGGVQGVQATGPGGRGLRRSRLPCAMCRAMCRPPLCILPVYVEFASTTRGVYLIINPCDIGPLLVVYIRVYLCYSMYIVCASTTYSVYPCVPLLLDVHRGCLCYSWYIRLRSAIARISGQEWRSGRSG